MVPTYPLFEVIDARTGEPVNVVIWQVRAIYSAKVGGKTLTRIEYANGDALDAQEGCTVVIARFYEGAMH
jgi:hypothetical protein